MRKVYTITMIFLLTSEAYAQESEAESGSTQVIDMASEIDPLSQITVVPGGLPTRIPFAVPDASKVGGEGGGEMAEEMIRVIRNDLEMTGLFQVMPVETYVIVDASLDGFTTSSVRYDDWYNVGASVVVKIRYVMEGGRGNFEFKLFNVDTSSQLPLYYPDKNLSASEVRQTAHDFVNTIIEFYTGEKGVFGSRILYAADAGSGNRRIQSFETDGANVHVYPLERGLNVLPSWGPKGGLLYTRLDKEKDAIYYYDSENDPVALTDFKGWTSGAAYCRKKSLIAFTGAEEDNPNIYVMKSDGTEMRQITDMEGNIQTSPSWSPGCDKIAFVSDYGGKPQIYIVDADGGNMRRLTWVGRYNTTPSWSPKGDLIAFTGRDERNVFDIFTINVSTGELTRLTQDQGHNREPSWSPDGRYLVFESTRDGKEPRLYLMSADGRWQTPLSKRPGLRTPCWR